ncbi:AAA family ATPase [Agrobacterium rhizogenes]|uniref:AAA family ATPase n=1 Tax=Rhizobium rhizogenes TaxID=359 RepID=UPI00115C6671|nr:AAA family ATPase [Rhizobium rhizogenes]NTG90861.1 AAA family ATPase [Rhizobium rhizogenes]NTI20134.1 AAA family ATPase [Rhizobium rhizogenes]NTI39183.1 AAA family ATPase [Rhizobium rhizogenes]TRB19856.1 hypothetical protein EXN70_26650 [Rhizobium rhizogenes]WEO69104.1 AAA family ATPase [Rhizobium rhizogenes]
MPFVILTGASGAGKTTIAEAIEGLHSQEIDVFYKDRIGVPSVQEMADKFGSVEEWQRAATFEWMARLSPLLTEGRRVLFEGPVSAFVSGRGYRTCGDYVLHLHPHRL